MAKGKTDVTFLIVIAVGLLIFVVGGLLADRFHQGAITPKDLLLSSNFGKLGNTQSTFTDISLGDFSVGVTRANKTLRETEYYTIKNGIFSKKEYEVDFNANDPEYAFLSFNILDTNLYGRLIIELNGKIELNTKVMASAPVKLNLKDVQPGKNKLIIKAQSSGIRFWAPTIYELKNIKLILNDYGIHKFKKIFTIHNYELQGFDRAELSFFVTKAEREEPLTIKVNGHTIYNQKPYIRPVPYTAVFYLNETNLKLGENVLEVATTAKSLYNIENALLKIFYFGVPNQTIVKRTFFVSSAQYKKISKQKYQGLIQFDNKVYLRGNLEITLKNETNNHTFDVFPTSGLNRIFFDKEEISRGENEVVIATDGSMEINNFEIRIVEKKR